MLDQIFKGEVPSIFETTIKRENGRTASPKSPPYINYRNEEEFLKELKATVCYCGSFLTFGMSAAVIGPTLLELGCVTHLKLHGVSWVFFAQGLAALLGSSFGGFLADRYDCTIILLECVISVALCLTIIPVCTLFPIMLTFFALLGVHMGVIDTVANSVLIRIHGRKVAPRLQALHFCYGLGALLSPVIAGPFLRDKCQGGHFQSNIFGWTLENSTLFTTYLETELEDFPVNVSRGALEPTAAHTVGRNKSYVQFAYWIVASLQLPVLASLSYLIYKQRQIRRSAPALFSGDVVTLTALPSRSNEGSKKELSQIFRPADEEETPSKSTFVNFQAKVMFVTVLAALLLFMYDGLQGAYGGYLYTYAIKSEIHLVTKKAALLNSLFWTLFAVGRFVSILVALFVSAEKMLITNLSGCFVAMSVMLYLHEVPLSLWIGSCTFGLFMSSVFPSTLSFTENYIEVTGPITSILIVSSASGEMLIPLLVGKEFDSHGPMSFLFVGFTICVLALLTLIGLRMVARAPLQLTVSELLHWVVGRACQCSSTTGGCFRSQNCKYTEMIPYETAAETAGSPVQTPKEENTVAREIHG